MKRLLLLGIAIFALLSIPLSKPKTQEEIINYTPVSETHCTKNKECYKINYNDTEFI